MVNLFTKYAFISNNNAAHQQKKYPPQSIVFCYMEMTIEQLNLLSVDVKKLPEQQKTP